MPALDTLLSGEFVYYALLLLVAGAVGGMFAGVNYLLASKVNRVEQRMRSAVDDSKDSLRPQPTDTVLTPLEQRTVADVALRPFARLATPTDAEEMGRLRAQLSHAGYRGERAMVAYLATKMLLCLGFAGVFLWVNKLSPQPMEKAAFFTVVLMIIGFYAPNFWLRGRAEERKAAIGNGLPDALDLLVTCVEAGLGLDIAINRVADEIILSTPLLSQELTQTALEMRAGVSRSDAFRRLSERTGVEEIKYLTSIVVQTEMFGTSIARSLRIMAEGMRVRRMQRAEERAATVAVRMTLPLILCILPSLFTVLLGPAVIRIVRYMAPTLSGETTTE